MYTRDSQHTTHNSKNYIQHWHTRVNFFLQRNVGFDVGIIIYPGRRWQNLNDSNVSSESTTCSIVHIKQKCRENKTRAPFARA